MRMGAGIMQAAGIIAVGVFVASWWGYGLLNPLFFTGFGGVSLLLAGPALLASCAQTVVRKIGIAVARASGATALILATSLVALNRGSPVEQVLVPEAATILDAALLSVAMAGLGASAALWLGQRFSPSHVRWGIRGAVLVGLLAFRQLPLRWTYAGMDAVLSWGLTPAVLVIAAVLTLMTVALARLAQQRIATMQA